MKVLLYGVGVIGSLTAHELCRAGNEVTVIARGRWKEVLEQQGLRIHAYSGNKEWTDYPEVLGEYDRNTYDVVFSIMQNQQQTEIVDTLACVQAKYVVLVGNNLQSEKMQQQLIDYGWNANQIIFGFQTSAGVRHEDYTEVITFGTPELPIGHVSRTTCKAGIAAMWHSFFQLHTFVICTIAICEPVPTAIRKHTSVPERKRMIF